jgi:precorrin-2 methylase
MKSGSGLERLKKALLERGESRRAALVARCGMQGEQVFPHSGSASAMWAISRW